MYSILNSDILKHKLLPCANEEICTLSLPCELSSGPLYEISDNSTAETFALHCAPLVVSCSCMVEQELS